MDPNYGGCLDEQNLQISAEDLESLYQQPQIPDSRDPCDSLNGSHFQSGDLGSQSVTGTELPVFLQVPIAGDDRDLSAFLDPAGINLDNQVIAGRPQPDVLQGSSEYFDDLNWLNGFQSGEFGNQPLAGTEQPDAPQAQSSLLQCWDACGHYPLHHEMTTASRHSDNDIEEFSRYYQTEFGFLPLISQPHVGQPAGSQAAAGGQDRLARKREVDRAYRLRKRAKTLELEVENQRLKTVEAEFVGLKTLTTKQWIRIESELVKLFVQNFGLESKILQLQGYNRSVSQKLETQSRKLNQLQDKLEFMQQLTMEHWDEQRNGKEKETLKEKAKKLEALRAEHGEMVADVKLEETLLQSLLSEVQSIRKQINQLLNKMPHNAGEKDSAIFQNS